MTRAKRGARSKPKGRDLTVLFLLPYMVAVSGAAGAMIGAIFTGAFMAEPGALGDGAGMLITGVVKAVAFAVAAAVLTGIVTALFDRESVLPFAAVAAVLVGSGYVLLVVVQTSFWISPWGCGVGGVLGAVLGVPAGLSMGKDDRSSPALRRAALRATRSKGVSAREFDALAAEIDAAGDGDGGDVDAGD